MRMLLPLLILTVAASAQAAPEPARTIELRCELTNTPSRTPGHPPDVFTQHVRVNLTAGTVDGHKATITDTQIGWEPRPGTTRPYATLSRPGWAYHSTGQSGRVPYEVTGNCVQVN